MMKRTGFVFFFVASICITMAAQSEPTLLTLNMPRYTWLARQARVQGIVKVAFTLPPHAGEPTKVELVSGPTISMGTAAEELKKTALENVKTWRFENGDAVEHRYETTFEFQLGGRSDLVSFQSFHYVTIVAGEPPIIANQE